jgi:XTP/dITP diphosphohydrolase
VKPLARIVVASQNPDKIAEIEAVLSELPEPPHVVRGLAWPEIAETEATLEGNALLKARAVLTITGIAALADDTGLEVRALDGAPGVHTARFAGPNAGYDENVTRLLALLEGVEDRRARFRTAVALAAEDGTEIVVEGCLDGSITEERRGDGGFGYDPVFAVDGRTLAQMSASEKNAISHRARALQALVEAVRTASA